MYWVEQTGKLLTGVDQQQTGDEFDQGGRIWRRQIDFR